MKGISRYTRKSMQLRPLCAPLDNLGWVAVARAQTVGELPLADRIILCGLASAVHFNRSALHNKDDSFVNKAPGDSR